MIYFGFNGTFIAFEWSWCLTMHWLQLSVDWQIPILDDVLKRSASDFI